MDIISAIEVLSNEVPNPSNGLPDELFYYISRTTPLVNVDLLIKDQTGRTLLAWRDDQHCGKGWHIPGGIVRFKETFELRIRKVAEIELGVCNIEFDPVPLDINQLIYSDRDVRSHFISLLYKCHIPNDLIPDKNLIKCENDEYLKWHTSCPDNLVECQAAIYKKYF